MTRPLELSKWSKIDLVLQKKSALEDDYVIEVFINEQFVMEKSLKGLRSWIKPEGTLHQVWTSDNFYAAANATIRNLAVYTPLLGRTIAIYADAARSFIFNAKEYITSMPSNSTITPATVAQCSVDYIKFKVVDAGGGNVGLWNISTKKFLHIQPDGTVAAIIQKPNGEFSDPKWIWEKFSITETPIKGLYTFYSLSGQSLGVRPTDNSVYGQKGKYVAGWKNELFSIHVVA